MLSISIISNKTYLAFLSYFLPFLPIFLFEPSLEKLPKSNSPSSRESLQHLLGSFSRAGVACLTYWGTCMGCFIKIQPLSSICKLVLVLLLYRVQIETSVLFSTFDKHSLLYLQYSALLRFSYTLYCETNYIYKYLCTPVLQICEWFLLEPS